MLRLKITETIIIESSMNHYLIPTYIFGFFVSSRMRVYRNFRKVS